MNSVSVRSAAELLEPPQAGEAPLSERLAQELLERRCCHGWSSYRSSLEMQTSRRPPPNPNTLPWWPWYHPSFPGNRRSLVTAADLALCFSFNVRWALLSHLNVV